MTPRPLATARLRLEPLHPDHAEAALAGFSDPSLFRYMPGSPRSELASLRDYFARLAAGSGNVDEAWLNWLVFPRATDTCVGWAQATLFRQRNASIAYVVFSPYQRRGYAREAAAAMLDALWAMPSVQEIEAQADVNNAPSLRVAEALGFTRDPGDVASELHGEPTRDFVYRLARAR